jgi:hypothetical protein
MKTALFAIVVGLLMLSYGCVLLKHGVKSLLNYNLDYEI